MAGEDVRGVRSDSPRAPAARRCAAPSGGPRARRRPTSNESASASRASEDQRDGPPREDVGAVRRSLQLEGTVKQRGQLVAIELVAGEEVTNQDRQCTFASMRLRLLTWNLFHGRAIPPAGRDLVEPFSAALAGWEWDVALLQEVPPWWVGRLAVRVRGGGAVRVDVEERAARGAAVPRGAAAGLRQVQRRGFNVTLVRGIGIEEQRVERLGWWPERRWMHAVRISSGAWVGNLHTEASAGQGLAAAAALRSWAEGVPPRSAGTSTSGTWSYPGSCGPVGTGWIRCSSLAGERRQ